MAPSVEIGRISSKHVRVTVASPKGGGLQPTTPRGHVTAAPLNNHVVSPAMDETAARTLLADEEMPAADHVEAMDTREGKSG